MRKSIATAAAVAALTAFLTMHPSDVSAQQTSIDHATIAEQGAKTPEVSTDQLRQILQSGSATLIDTRSVAEFDAGHIPGAVVLDVPGPEQVAAVSRVVGGDKAKPLVLYCNGPFCQASRRLAEQLLADGFSAVRRYQLGMPIWRALGGPVVVELGGIKRIHGADRTAVFLDVRTADDFSKGSIPGARSAPIDSVLSGALKKVDLPEDDFNRRIVVFGQDGAQARRFADYMSKRPWHNVSYFPGTYAELKAGLGASN